MELQIKKAHIFNFTTFHLLLILFFMNLLETYFEAAWWRVTNAMTVSGNSPATALSNFSSSKVFLSSSNDRNCNLAKSVLLRPPKDSYHDLVRPSLSLPHERGRRRPALLGSPESVQMLSAEPLQMLNSKPTEPLALA